MLFLLAHPDLHVRYCQDLGVHWAPELVASQGKRVRRTPRGGVLTEKDAQIYPHFAPAPARFTGLVAPRARAGPPGALAAAPPPRPTDRPPPPGARVLEEF